MAKNKLTDLNNHLFEQLERLNDEDLKGEELEKEIKRSEAVVKVSQQIISNGSLILRAKVHAEEYGYGRKNRKLPGPLKSDE